MYHMMENQPSFHMDPWPSC